ANACWGPAFWPRGLVTGRAGRTDGLIAPRDPPRKGTQTTRTRRAGSGMLLKILLCTQLAPARHVVQVGEKISTRRGCPVSRLNSDLSVEIPVSEITPPPPAAEPGPGEAVPPPAAGAADEHDARTRPAAPAAATTASRDLRRSRQATRIPIRLLSPTSMTPPSTALRRPRSEALPIQSVDPSLSAA